MLNIKVTEEQREQIMKSKYWRIVYSCCKTSDRIYGEDWMLFTSNDINEFHNGTRRIRSAVTAMGDKILVDDETTFISCNGAGYYSQRIMENPYFRA